MGRDKYYVRHGERIAGVRYTPPKGDRAGLVMIGGPKLDLEHIQRMLDILFVNTGGLPNNEKGVTWAHAARGYKPRAYVTGISIKRWDAFRGNLTARGYSVEATERFGRLMR